MMPRTKQGMRVVMVGMGVVRMVAARTILEAIVLIAPPEKPLWQAG